LHRSVKHKNQRLSEIEPEIDQMPSGPKAERKRAEDLAQPGPVQTDTSKPVQVTAASRAIVAFRDHFEELTGRGVENPIFHDGHPHLLPTADPSVPMLNEYE
jgi:hypothetical protein